MPVYAIPEDNNKSACPSLYTIIQFLCTVTSFSLLLLCFCSTLWIETFIYVENRQFRVYTIGLWKICFYNNLSNPGTPDSCETVKYKDFTLSVQVCQCFALAASSVALILSLARIAISLLVGCSNCDESRASYEIRKYRIVCHLVTTLALLVSIPLYICEAHIEGVRLTTLSKRDMTTEEHIANSTSILHANGSHIALDSNTVTMTDHIPYGQYSVFAWALWMQFGVLGFTIIVFSMALIKHINKRKLRYAVSADRRQNSRSRPNFSLEFKSRPRSESQRAFVRQSSSVSIQDMPLSP